MIQQHIRHLFPGSNTCAGFWGYYANLRARARRCIILKGGPGVGKSTMIKAAGQHYEELGQPVIYFHCSGDPDSLDGMLAPEADFLMLDGTAPHPVDPTMPGAEDGIVNLGVCLDEKELRSHRDEIEAVTREMAACFAQAHRYLKGAETLRGDAEAVYRAAFSEKARRNLQRELLSLLPGGPEGEAFHLYAQAITGQGVIQQIDSILTDTVYCLDVPWGFPADDLLQRLQRGAADACLAMECYHDPLNGKGLLHLAVGSSLFTTAVAADQPLFSPQLDQAMLRRQGARLAFDRAVYDLTLNQAVEALAQAKEKHDQLERYYMDAMDYGRLSAIRQELMEALPR